MRLVFISSVTASTPLRTISTMTGSILRLPAATATERLARLGFTNVHVHVGDGTLGWPEAAPYEAIAVAAGAPRPPPSLLQQLTIGGRIVLPHGNESMQRLARITRKSQTEFVEENLGDVRFVPLVGAEGWPLGRL